MPSRSSKSSSSGSGTSPSASKLGFSGTLDSGFEASEASASGTGVMVLGTWEQNSAPTVRSNAIRERRR